MILGELEAERIVEVGPANILTNMMKRTRDDSFLVHEAVRGINRRILGPKGDLNEIYYQVEPEVEAEGEVKSEITPADTQEAAPRTPSSEGSKQDNVQHQTSLSGGPVEECPDVEVPTIAIVMAIISTKLKKQPGEIKTDATINGLVGGELKWIPKDVAEPDLK